MDYYRNFKNLENSFKKFATNIPFYGSSIICLDDINSKTLVSAASIEPQIRNEHSSSNKSVVAKAVGELLAKRLQENGIKQLVFDRGGYKFHGRVKALADGVKSMGVQI